MKNSSYYILVLEFVLALALVCAYDPDPLQDFCVATNHPQKNGVFVNGKVCKDPKNVTSNDFYYPRIDIATEFDNRILGTSGTTLDVKTFPGINTLGVSIKRVEYQPKGIGSPLINPRGSEILVVLKGSLKVGFVTSNLDGNRLFKKTLKKGDVFAFPIGLVHFKQNVGNTNAVTLNAFGSQNPGTILLPQALFGSRPRIDPIVLAKSFQLKQDVIDYLQSIKWEE